MSRSNEELALAYQNGELEALPVLWTQVKGIACLMTGRYRSLAMANKAADGDDLMQAAFLGVERAARAFAPDAGAFTTVMKFYVLKEFYALLGLQGRFRREHYDAGSVDMAVSGTDDLTLLGGLPDESLPDEDEALLLEDIRREVHAAIERLTDKQGAAVRASFLEGLSCGAIGARMGVSKAAAAQLRVKGIRAMRRDWRLQRLVRETCCWRRKGVTAFNTSWSSVVEDAVMRWDG